MTGIDGRQTAGHGMIMCFRCRGTAGERLGEQLISILRDVAPVDALGLNWTPSKGDGDEEKCQSARKVDPGSASKIDPLVVHEGERPTGWSWSGLRSPVGRVG